MLREAGTNVLRHGHPEQVRIVLAPEGLTVLNDGAGAGPAPEHGSGLQGLASRLGPGGTLRTRLEGGTYRLEARFAPENVRSDTEELP